MVILLGSLYIPDIPLLVGGGPTLSKPDSCASAGFRGKPHVPANPDVGGSRNCHPPPSFWEAPLVVPLCSIFEFVIWS